MAVRDNTKAGNSVKKTSSVLHIRGCTHLPLQQVFKIIMSPDSTFYKLHSDIYFAKVSSLAMRVRTIFRKTPLKVYSTLKKSMHADKRKFLLMHHFHVRSTSQPSVQNSVALETELLGRNQTRTCFKSFSPSS